MDDALQLMIKSYAVSLVDALDRSRKAADWVDHPFERGSHHGFYLALNMLLNRARSSGIEPKAIGLEGIDPDDFM